MLGDTTLRCMREKHKDQWVTADTVRNNCDRGGGYTRRVLETAAELEIIEKKTELRPILMYRIDPTEGKIACPIEPEKPYEETICSRLEKTLDNCSQDDGECKEAVLDVIKQSMEDALEAKDYRRVRTLSNFAEAVVKLPKGDKASNIPSRQQSTNHCQPCNYRVET